MSNNGSDAILKMIGIRESERIMNYIVLDLEWNQAAYKVDEEEEIPFEIIEIGAVKLNDKAEKIDQFSCLIRPQIYPFLLRRTKEITGLRDDDLDRDGIYFEDAGQQFLDWCGKDYIFCIWGPSDLTQLERNLAYYDIRIPWKYPLKYLDVQKLYALQMKEGKTRRTLEYVIGAMEIPVDGPFHRAIEDAEYTAQVFRRIDREHYESFFSVDYYRIPKNRFEEATFYFETYSKYVSRKFNLKEEAVKNRRVREMPCLYCRRQMKKEINWFSDGGHSYFALATCKTHGLMKGRIRIKTTENYDGVFAVRTIKPCSEEDQASIVKKRENLTAKRRERRKKESSAKKARAEAENNKKSAAKQTEKKQKQAGRPE